MTPTMTRADAERRIKLAAGDRVAVVAGSGRLPVHSPFIVKLAGEAGDDPALASFEHERLALEEIGSLLPLLKRRKITHVVLAGGVSRRPHWRQIRLTLALLRILPRILMALARGDDGLLRAVIGQIEAEGFKVLGAHEIVPDLLAPEGPMTRARPRKGDLADLDAALAAARAIGALDIGQAAVAIGGRVVALEGVEGTDGLLERVKELRHHGRVGGRKRGVLVKCAKPGQELRADLPGIGPATVDAAHAAGLAGIGVEAGHSLVLDFGEMLKRADALGLFVVGLPAGGES
jgi:DUF1009 family protein